MTPAKGSPAMDTPGSSGDLAWPPAMSHFTRKGSANRSGEVAEAGDDCGHAEVGGLVGDELDVDDVARLGAFDVDGARERMAEPEVEREHVRMRAVRA